MSERLDYHDSPEKPGQTGKTRAGIERWLQQRLAERLAIAPTEINIHEPLQSYGLTSVEGVGLSGDLEDWLGRDLSPTLVYDYPSIAQLARYLTGEEPDVAASPAGDEQPGTPAAADPIAIIGMACHFPGGANSPEAFWELLQQGTDTSAEIPAERWQVDDFYDPTPNAPGKMYTRHGCFVHDIEQFDAYFFGISPREALRMDPQQRLLLEVAWEALENAGLDTGDLESSPTGVFIGMMNNHEYAQLQMQQGDESYLDDPYFGIGSAASIASGRLPYLLDLRGPALAIDTACSSSLVAVHLACQSLRNGECQLALVGGVNAVLLPENMVNACKMNMLAADGRCKTFDASADGFVMGEGCGLVVLKRLSAALRDHDTVLAVIRGSAVNQDGRSNGLTAPNRLAQEAVIRQALRNARIEPQAVSYVEAHGSGTALGDPIEIEALHNVLGQNRTDEQDLLVGSVKTNIGHLAGAAGIAGLIKTVLALQHRKIPAHLHLTAPNPHIPWHRRAITIPTSTVEWQTGSATRVAGVSSFGWSGTNAHLILEEAPLYQAVETPTKPTLTRSWQLLPLSAKTETALEQVAKNLATSIQNQPATPLADIAYSLQRGRGHLDRRRWLVCREREDAVTMLAQDSASSEPTGQQVASVAFLFPGLGEHLGAAQRELFATEPAFRQVVDDCCALLRARTGLDLTPSLFPQEPLNGHNGIGHAPATQANSTRIARDLPALPGRNGHATSQEMIPETALAQPMLFIVEYALARLLMEWGIRPQAMLGYSLGEYVAACLAGVFSLEDALMLVAQRAQLIQRQPRGMMLAVALAEHALQPYLSESVSLAAVNAPNTCVLSGPVAELTRLAEQFEAQEIVFRRVETTHAFHSRMLEPLRAELTGLVERVQLHAPMLPYISNVTGTWITPEQATNPAYWAEHMCQTVRFASGVEQLLREQGCALLEVGPGQSLSSFAKQHPACTREHLPLILSTLPAAHERQSACFTLLTASGKLWQLGLPLDWRGFTGNEQRQRISLPTYPFERQRYWIEREAASGRTQRTLAAPQGKRRDVGDWFYLPAWEQATLHTPARPGTPRAWLIFAHASGIGAQLARRLQHDGHSVIRVCPGEQFARLDTDLFTLRPAVAADYVALLNALQEMGQIPATIVHTWSVYAPTELHSETNRFLVSQERGLYSLLSLAQALGGLSNEAENAAQEIVVLSSNMQAVSGKEALQPEKATLLAACKVIPQEYQSISCRSIDLLNEEETSIDLLLAELYNSTAKATTVAYRADVRSVQTFRPTRLEQPTPASLPLRQRGVYLITGGLGGLGLVLARYLASNSQARLALLSRSSLPARSAWQNWLETHDGEDAIGKKIEAIQELEALGAEVLLLQTDIADAGQVRQAIERIDEHFGALHGVVHAAGVFETQAFGVIQEIDPVAVCEAHFRPKVYGTIALERALQDRPLDFCLLYSSLVSVLGGLGFVGYTAANAFLDAFAHQHNQGAAAHWTSLGWDIWQVKEERHGVHRYGVMGSTVSLYSMTAEEGMDAFSRMLAAKDYTHIITSTGDLQERISRWLLLETVQQSRRRAATTPSLKQARPALTTSYVPADGETERQIVAIFQEELGIEQIGLYDNFFDLGGNSLLGLQVIARLKNVFHMQIPAVALFEAPTVSTLARYLKPAEAPACIDRPDIHAERRRRVRQGQKQEGIAIIGMSGRWPGADSVEQFWQNLCNGVESITFFSDEELLAAGVDPKLVHHPDYIKARPIMRDIDRFDANFFGYSPREAELTDPQHRLFLECAWEALEHAGYDPYTYSGLISVFGGSNLSTYLLDLATSSDILASVDGFQLGIGNDKDSLTTTVSYKLNLKGPSLAVQTFCSTSLVATHLACQQLLHGECDLALAGGVSIRVPTIAGYLYQEGGMESPDGHCRTFDAQARGSIFGDGVAVVTLKRLSDAVEDGDYIYAVIKGSAINNDGSLKVSYSAPSVVGQTEVVALALANAGVSAESISYVEAHGTATELGDPIEMASLTRAYRSHTQQTGYCAIGSVKTNIGHLDRAAGATGLIKTALALKYGQIPASLHYQTPNPEIDFVHSPFYVNTRLAPWERNGHPRRAGVNSLGMGGTNAHVVLEEAPPTEPGDSGRSWQLLPLSARTEAALNSAIANLRACLQKRPDLNLADVAYTLQAGRSAFEYRQFLLCRTREEALAALQAEKQEQTLRRYQTRREQPVAFLFPGTGEQYVGLARQLYRQEATFREIVDYCCTQIKTPAHVDLYQLLFGETEPQESHEAVPASRAELRALLGRSTQNGNGHQGKMQASSGAEQIRQTSMAQPVVFIIEYALARLLMEWGLYPQAMLGYSLGEYVAACLAGVFSLEDALTLVSCRAQLIQDQPRGAMLAVALSEEALQELITPQVNLAVINAPHTCVLAGPEEAIAETEQILSGRGTSYRRVETTHAFHSTMLMPVQAELTRLAQSIKLHPPAIPYISNVTGTWITPEQATDPAYWARHMCQTVRFADGVACLLQETEHLLVEVGPGQALGSFVRQHPACDRERMQQVCATLPAEREYQSGQSEQATLLTALGKLWLAGASINWEGFHAHERRLRVPLPTYPFERQRYWLEPQKRDSTLHGAVRLLQDAPRMERKSAIADWFYQPIWKQVARVHPAPSTAPLEESAGWLVLTDDCGIGTSIGEQLRLHHQGVVSVLPGTSFSRQGEKLYSLRPDARADYTALLRELQASGQPIKHIVHLWTLTSTSLPSTGTISTEILQRGFYSLLALAQALGDLGMEQCAITIVTNDLLDVTGGEHLCPGKATILGPCRVIPQEYPNLTCRVIDISLGEISGNEERWLKQFILELASWSTSELTALRGTRYWEAAFAPVSLPASQPQSILREGGTYLITGGLGGIGLAVAEYLARTVHAKLVLVGRSVLPERAGWPEILKGDEAGENGRRVRQVLALEGLGAEVMIMQADVANEKQMREVVQQAVARFGALHGCFHAAGLPGNGLIQLKTPEQAARVLRPKVQGTLALDRVLRDTPLDFLALFSSTTAITGSPGQVDYCAANAFLDAYARSESSRRVISLNWSEWQWNAWEESLAGYGDMGNVLKENRLRYGLTFAEGTEALSRALASLQPQLVVSTQDFDQLIELSKSFTVATLLQERQLEQQGKTMHLRPEMETTYVAPGNELERQIAQIWEQLLGIERVGVQDNFFDLGGNSLLGIDLIAHLRRALDIKDLPAYVLFEAPSISAMASYLAQNQRAASDEKTRERSAKRRESLKQRMQEPRRLR